MRRSQGVHQRGASAARSAVALVVAAAVAAARSHPPSTKSSPPRPAALRPTALRPTAPQLHELGGDSARVTVVSACAYGSTASGAARLARRCLGGQDEADDEAIQAKRLGEDEDQDHAHVQLGLLSRCAHARVADDADRNPGGHAAEAAREAGREMSVAGERGVLRLATSRRGDCGNESGGSR